MGLCLEHRCRLIIDSSRVRKANILESCRHAISVAHIHWQYEASQALLCAGGQRQAGGGGGQGGGQGSGCRRRGTASNQSDSASFRDCLRSMCAGKMRPPMPVCSASEQCQTVSMMTVHG